MAAPVVSNSSRLELTETAIEKDDCWSWIRFHYGKNSFLGKSNIKNRKGFRTCAWRAALCTASHKINGRRSAPPVKWLPKNREVWFWCIYTIPLKLILSKIPDFVKCRACGAANPPNPAARSAWRRRSKSAPLFLILPLWKNTSLQIRMYFLKL